MRQHKITYLGLLIVCIAVIGWTASAAPPQQSNEPTATPAVAPMIPQVVPPEARVHILRMTRPAAANGHEYSGLAWYGDTLVLLPQFPPNVLYTIDKATLRAATRGRITQLDPVPMPFRVNGDLDIPGFQGYEAIAFYENTVYLTIESGSGGRMHSHLLVGTVSEEGIEMDASTLVEIPQPVSIGNKADEAIVMVGNQPLTFLEWNSSPNPNPTAHLYSPDDGTITAIPFLPLPYRLTDATEMDEEGRFWVINYLPRGEGSRTDTGFWEMLNYRASHGEHPHVERLLEVQFVDNEIVLLDDAPLYLQLDNEERNWEGIVRLDNRGFILITDSYPQTLLAFVPYRR